LAILLASMGSAATHEDAFKFFMLSIILFSRAQVGDKFFSAVDKFFSAVESRCRQSTGNGERPSERVHEHKSTPQTHLLKDTLNVKLR